MGLTGEVRGEGCIICKDLSVHEMLTVVVRFHLIGFGAVVSVWSTTPHCRDFFTVEKSFALVRYTKVLSTSAKVQQLLTPDSGSNACTAVFVEVRGEKNRYPESSTYGRVMARGKRKC